MAGAALLATGAVSLIARPLDVLATGETTAQSLGLDLPRWRMIIVLLAGVLTAGAVIQGGTIGFVGMVVVLLGVVLDGIQRTYRTRFLGDSIALTRATSTPRT